MSGISVKVVAQAFGVVAFLAAMLAFTLEKLGLGFTLLAVTLIAFLLSLVQGRKT